jgi:hypothetical protein
MPIKLNHMKNFIFSLLLLASIGLFFTSCSKDDSNEISASSLVGKWTVASYQIANFENSGETIDDTKNAAVRPIIEIKSDGTLTSNLFGSVATMTYTVKGDEIVLNKALAFETHNSFTFTLSGDMLTLKREDKFSVSGESYTEYTTIMLKRN